MNHPADLLFLSNGMRNAHITARISHGRRADGTGWLCLES